MNRSFNSHWDITFDPTAKSASLLAWNKYFNAPPPDIISRIDKMDGDSSGLSSENDFRIADYIDSYELTLDNIETLSHMTLDDMLHKSVKRVYNNIHHIVVNIEILPDIYEDVVIVDIDIAEYGRSVNKLLLTLGDIVFVCHDNETKIRTKYYDASKIAQYLASKNLTTGGGQKNILNIILPKI